MPSIMLPGLRPGELKIKPKNPCAHTHQGYSIRTPLHFNGMLKKVLLLSVAARGLLTTYCLTSSSLLKLNNLRILLALLGPRRRGIVLSVRPGIS